MMDSGDSLLVSIKTYCRDSDQVFQSLPSPPVEGGGELEVEHGASSLTIKILIEVQFGLRATLPAGSREGRRDEARKDLVAKAAPACAGAPARMHRRPQDIRRRSPVRHPFLGLPRLPRATILLALRSRARRGERTPAPRVSGGFCPHIYRACFPFRSPGSHLTRVARLDSRLELWAGIGIRLGGRTEKAGRQS